MSFPSSDAATVLEQNVRLGDKHALAELFSLYRERLLRIIHFRMDLRLHGRVEPDDILQEAYIAAANRLDYFQREFSGTSFVWLRMITVQTLTDLHRRHLAAQKRGAGQEILRIETSISMTLASGLFGHVRSPSKIIVTMDMIKKADQAIASMNEVDQQILALRHFEELTNKETAEALGIEQKAASIRYYRALVRLKEILADYSAFLDMKTS
jgi:RNA polymerase sigma-70 factor (ECF subfamily)